MRTTISTGNGDFEIPGLSAKILGLFYKIIVPLGSIIGFLGIMKGIYNADEFVLIAAVVALTASYVLKIFVETVFENYGINKKLTKQKT
jgi:hypothetical protein